MVNFKNATFMLYKIAVMVSDDRRSLDMLSLGVEIRQSTIYYDGLLGRWDKRIVNQESDVPSIIFLYFL